MSIYRIFVSANPNLAFKPLQSKLPFWLLEPSPNLNISIFWRVFGKFCKISFSGSEMPFWTLLTLTQPKYYLSTIFFKNFQGNAFFDPSNPYKPKTLLLTIIWRMFGKFSPQNNKGLNEYWTFLPTPKPKNLLSTIFLRTLANSVLKKIS